MHSFSFPCSGVKMQATEEEEMNITHTKKALTGDILDYFQDINCSLC